MNWDELIKEERLITDLYPEPKEWEKYDISAFEKDYKKVVAYPGFRRLQDKTQVFPLDKSDFVRTRLTHSIEVSMIAKQLWTMAYTYILVDKRKNTELFPLEEKTAQHAGEVLMCAGLLHDLGNPPFGHFGETVIGSWFYNHFKDDNFRFSKDKVSNLLSEPMLNDFKHFEGNAQSLRLILKSCNGCSLSDLNLTNAVIHTLMKYPTDSMHYNKEALDIKEHKNGYFLAEKELIEKMASSLGTKTDSDIVRHPLTFLLEAADDIAYSTADLEDAFKKNFFTLGEYIDFFDDELSSLAKKYSMAVPAKAKELINPLRDVIKTHGRSEETDRNAFYEWVNQARGWLMYCAAFGFTNNYSKIMEGKYKHDLFFGTFHRLSIEALKNAMVQFAFHSSSIVKLELSAQTIIISLLDKFIPAILYFKEDKSKGEQTTADRKYTDLISENYKNDYMVCRREGDDGYNLYLRFLLVTDYISGMTDSFAKMLYQELNGIS